MKQGDRMQTKSGRVVVVMALVSDLLAVTREIEAIERASLGLALVQSIEPLLVRRDAIERALARAVKQ